MKLLLICLTILHFTNINAQTGTGKFKYVDDELSNTSKTYSAAEFHFSIGFELNWKLAYTKSNQNNKINLVICPAKDDTLNSYIFRDEQEFKYVTTLGIMLAKNYNLILAYKPVFDNDNTKTEVSIFYEEDGILYNYPNKYSKNSISGKIYTREKFSDGTNNYLQKIALEDGSFLILKNDFYLYALKLKGVDCIFKIDD